MAASGNGPWFPKLADIMDEAFEIGTGKDPATLSQRHLTSAARSYNRILIDLDNEGGIISRMDPELVSIAAGTPTFFTPTDTLGIDSLIRRDKGSDFELTQTSYLDWFQQPNKGQAGQPNSFTLFFGKPRDLDQFIVDKNGDPITPVAPYGEQPYGLGNFNTGFDEEDAYDPERYGPQVILWPVPDKDIEILYSRIRLSQEGYALGENPDFRRIWTNAVVMKLAADLALKFNEQKFPVLKQEAAEAMTLARRENRDRSDIVIGAVGFDLRYRGNARRHRRR